MSELLPTAIIAFRKHICVADDAPEKAGRTIKELIDISSDQQVLIFDKDTARPVEIDFRGTVDDVHAHVVQRVAPEAEAHQDMPRGPGRPKLGVVPREVTLLPRHWEWLAKQPGGASVALRKLVEDARRVNADKDRRRDAQETAHRFLTAIAGDLSNFEDALRALYAGDKNKFDIATASWPVDIRHHAARFADAAFNAASDAA